MTKDEVKKKVMKDFGQTDLSQLDYQITKALIPMYVVRQFLSDTIDEVWEEAMREFAIWGWGKDEAQELLKEYKDDSDSKNEERQEKADFEREGLDEQFGDPLKQIDDLVDEAKKLKREGEHG